MVYLHDDYTFNGHVIKVIDFNGKRWFRTIDLERVVGIDYYIEYHTPHYVSTVTRKQIHNGTYAFISIRDALKVITRSSKINEELFNWFLDTFSKDL